MVERLGESTLELRVAPCSCSGAETMVIDTETTAEAETSAAAQGDEKKKLSECSQSTRSPAKGAGPRRRVRRRAMHALRRPAPALRQICSGADRAGFLVAAIREGQFDPDQIPHPRQPEAMA